MLLINNIYKNRFNINKNIKKRYSKFIYYKSHILRNIIMNNNLYFYNIDKIYFFMMKNTVLCMFDEKGTFNYSINNDKNNFIK